MIRTRFLNWRDTRLKVLMARAPIFTLFIELILVPLLRAEYRTVGTYGRYRRYLRYLRYYTV